MPAQPVIGSTSWGATQNAFTGTSLDSATGKIKNEALQVASTAPIADAALANKKYVDDSVGAMSAYTDEDSETNAMLKSHAYKAQTGGFVSVIANMDSPENLRGWVGLTDDPAGAGIQVQAAEATGSSQDMSLFFAVAKDEYFEITSDVTPTILWKSFGELSKPVDQD